MRRKPSIENQVSFLLFPKEVLQVHKRGRSNSFPLFKRLTPYSSSGMWIARIRHAMERTRLPINICLSPQTYISSHWISADIYRLTLNFNYQKWAKEHFQPHHTSTRLCCNASYSHVSYKPRNKLVKAHALWTARLCLVWNDWGKAAETALTLTWDRENKSKRLVTSTLWKDLLHRRTGILFGKMGVKPQFWISYLSNHPRYLTTRRNWVL